MDKDEQNRTLIIDPKPTLLLPPRQLIRRMIEAGLPTDAALSAFCLDCFPTIVRQFTAEMSRTRKLNLLIETIDETALSQALHHYLQAKNRPLLSSAPTPPTQAQPQPVPKSHKRKRGKTRRSLDFVLRMKDVLLGGLLVGPLRKLSDWLSEIWMSLTGAVSALLAVMSKSTLVLWGVLGFVGTGLVLKVVSDPGVVPIPPEYLSKPTRPKSIRQTEGGHSLPPTVAYKTEVTMPIEDAKIRLAPVRSLPNLSLDLSEVPRTPSVPAEGLTHSSPLPIIKPEPKRLRDVALKKKARPLLPPDFNRIPPLPDLPTGSHRKPDACKAAGTNPGRGTGC